MKGSKKIILATILTIAAVGQIILSFLLYDENGITAIRNIGWVILWISAIFGWLPIFTLRKLGGVPQGKGYVHTTVLVDQGVYAIVRHPQYLAGMLLGLALSFIAQHWVVAVLGALAIIVYYVDTYEEEAASIEKFGGEYRRYMERVPRVNFILGILRFVQAKQ
jgi:protein-S-isoprenylcysteine O-methyltransferase Ste14